MNREKSLNEFNVGDALAGVNDWFELGKKLKLPDNELDVIRLDYNHYGLKHMRSRMVNLWLRTKLKASWRRLCVALEAINEREAAESIRVKYNIPGDTVQRPVPTSSSSSSTSARVTVVADMCRPALDVLNIDDDLYDVITALKPLSNKWKDIGRGLRIKAGTLDALEQSHTHDPPHCLGEVLSEYLKQNYNTHRFGLPSWVTIEKVARSYNKRVADGILDQYIPDDD